MPKKPKTPPPPTEDEVELLVQELMEAEPAMRTELVYAIKDSVVRPGGTNVAWDQLSRSRKPYGPNGGLQFIVNMLDGFKEEIIPGIDRSGIEPAVQLLAFFCNFRPYATTIAKLKKIMTLIFNVLKDWQNSNAARASATWVLRRCTEFSNHCRIELSSNRDFIVLMSRIMMGDDLKPKEPPDILGINSGSSTPRISRSPSRPGTGTASKASRLPSSASSAADSKPVMQRSLTTAPPKASSLDVVPKAPVGPPAASSMPVRPPGGPPVSASMPIRPITARSMGSQGSKGSRPGTAVTYAPGSWPQTASATRPGTALQSRPSTAIRPSTSGTIFSMTHVRPDVMCMEANCCAAIGNAALRDDSLERLGKTEGVMLAIIHLLENGSYWAQGHAARTLGNLLPSNDNIKHLESVDARNTAAHALHSMLLNDSQLRNKELALHTIGNMVRSPTFCVVFNRLDGFQSTLLRLAQEDSSTKEATARITACLSQQRLGTRTWRPYTRIEKII